MSSDRGGVLPFPAPVASHLGKDNKSGKEHNDDDPVDQAGAGVDRTVIAHANESRPEIRIGFESVRLFNMVDLGQPQRIMLAASAFQVLVERTHEFGAGPVGDLPEGHDNAGAAGIKESPGEAHHSFPFKHFPVTTAAGAEYDHPG